MHHPGRDKFSLADHSVEGGVFRRELKETGKTQTLRLETGRRLARSLGHRVADSLVEVKDDLVKDLSLTLEVQIERPLGYVGGFGDFDDRSVVVAERPKDPFGCFEQLATCALTLALARTNKNTIFRHGGKLLGIERPGRHGAVRAHESLPG